jgi:hypothetical protein
MISKEEEIIQLKQRIYDLEENEDESSEIEIVAHRGYNRPKIVHHDNDDDD